MVQFVLGLINKQWNTACCLTETLTDSKTVIDVPPTTKNLKNDNEMKQKNNSQALATIKYLHIS